MAALAVRLAERAILEGNLDHWNFTGLGERFVPSLQFSVRYADTNARGAVEEITQHLPPAAVRALLKGKHGTIVCEYRDATVDKSKAPRMYVETMVMKEVWTIVKKLVPTP